MTGKREYGVGGESAAVEHLRRKGYKIIERNYRSRMGEIDIIARHKGVMVFVEVKARRSRRYGHAKWAVTPAKQRKISMTALDYLKRHASTDIPARFDVVTVHEDDSRQHIEVITSAFELAYP